MATAADGRSVRRWRGQRADRTRLGHGRLQRPDPHPPDPRAYAEEWTWVFAHLLIHLGLGHADARPAAHRTRLPAPRATWPSTATCTRSSSAAPSFSCRRASPPQTRRRSPGCGAATGIPAEYDALGVGRRDIPTYCRRAGTGMRRSAEVDGELFAAGLSAAAAPRWTWPAGRGRRWPDPHRSRQRVGLALGWFVSSYPLLGAHRVQHDDRGRGGARPRPGTSRWPRSTRPSARSTSTRWSG